MENQNVRDLKSITKLSDFAYFSNFYKSLNSLESLAMTENWAFSHPDPGRQNKKNPILESYFHHTFKRALELYKSSSEDDKSKYLYIDSNCACFNTGLYTQNYNAIYAVFRPSLKQTDKLPFSFKSFEQESSNTFSSIKDLPKRVTYFSDISELIYDSSLPLRANVEHILQENVQRFPATLVGNPMLTTLFSGAIELAKKRVSANYRAAVPTYYRNEICLLLPISLTDPSHADLALAIKRNNGFYTAKTCLTLDMAYNDARLIARPDSDWLIL